MGVGDGGDGKNSIRRRVRRGMKHRAFEKKELHDNSQERKLAKLSECENRKEMELYAHALQLEGDVHVERNGWGASRSSFLCVFVGYFGG